MTIFFPYFVQGQTLVVDLVSFDTDYNGSTYTMDIHWETASESDVAGFNLYRSDSFSSKGDKINASIIMTEGSPSTGAVYQFSDEPDSSGRYYYQLAEVSLSTGAEIFYRPSIDNDGEEDWDDFVKVFIDEESVVSGDYHWFNEGTEEDPGDGRKVSIIITSSGMSGSITVKQTNAAPEDAPGADVCPWRWEITSDVGAQASTDFFYNVADLKGTAENSDYVGIAIWNAAANSWQWQGGAVYTGDHKIRLDDSYPDGYFVLYRRMFGDVTGDGYVDEADLQRFADVWLHESDGEFPQGSDERFFNYNKNESDGKQIIDEGDLQVFSDNWLHGTPK